MFDKFNQPHHTLGMTWRQVKRKSERLFFLDWLHIIALMVLIAYHVGMYYVTWDFHVKSPFASHALEPWMKLTEPWRMSLLFMISGAATITAVAAALVVWRGVGGATTGVLASGPTLVAAVMCWATLGGTRPAGWSGHAVVAALQWAALVAAFGFA